MAPTAKTFNFGLTVSVANIARLNHGLATRDGPQYLRKYCDSGRIPQALEPLRDYRCDFKSAQAMRTIFFLLLIAVWILPSDASSLPEPMNQPTNPPLPVDADAAIMALRAPGPLAAYRESLMLFGQFIGTWDMDIHFFDKAGKEVFHGPGQWSFSWVLDGRAVQDVLVSADTTDPSRTAPGERHIGTTLRYYDPKLDAWRIVWLGATSGTFLVLSARPGGKDILIKGTDMDGSFLRWTFTEITPERFLWIGRTSKDHQHWRVEQEMYGRRRSASSPQH